MAGDWIKMRADLHTHPKIVRMASALKADRLRIVGGLHSAWCLFDVHSVDGFLDGYTAETLDDMIGFPGFSRAMMAVGWLEMDGENLVMPRFDEHNGQSAKRRAQDAARKKSVRKMSASDADKMKTREEKRREDIKETDPPVVPRGKKATQMPKGFAPSEKHQLLAGELGADLNSEFLAFTDFHVSKGSVFKDWDAALNTWLRNARKFGQRQTSGIRSTGVVTSKGDYNSIPEGFRGS